MLTRRQIRVKVVQAVYAQYNGNALSLNDGANAIQRSCHDMGLLYFTHLALFKALWEFASEQNKIQTSQRRSDTPLNSHYPKIQELGPLATIAKHPFLKQKIAQNKITIWELEFDYVRTLLKKLSPQNCTKSTMKLTRQVLRCSKSFWLNSLEMSLHQTSVSIVT